ncbi:hypothetical protein Ancab_011382 [Ancistrocladus abbreviatus]
MEVELNFESLFPHLKLDEPWLPPKPWESIPSESGGLSHSSLPSLSSHNCRYDLSSVSEESLVRLVINALQGVQSALVSVQKLSAAFCSDPADRSVYRIPSLWSRSLSTHTLGKMLKSVGYSGCVVFLLRKLVEYYTNLSFGGKQMKGSQVVSKLLEKQNPENRNMDENLSFSLVNHAFSVAVEKVLEGYICALDTMNAAAHSRRSLHNVNGLSNASSRLGSLTSIMLSGVTVLEVYLHTKELRTQIESLGNLCRLCNIALCFAVTPMEDLVAKAEMEFCNFPIGGNLLTYLYNQLKVVLHDTAFVHGSNGGGTADFQSSFTLDETTATAMGDLNEAPQNSDSEASNMIEEFLYALDPLESSECSSTVGSGEEIDPAPSTELPDSAAQLEQNYLSALCFFSGDPVGKCLQTQKLQSMESNFVENFTEKDVSGHLMEGCHRETNLMAEALPDERPLELSRSWVYGILYAGHQPDLGWPVGGLLKNPFVFDWGYRANSRLHSSGNGQHSEGSILFSGGQSSPKCFWIPEESDQDQFLDNGRVQSNSYVLQSWNVKYHSNILSMNPMLTRSTFLGDVPLSRDDNTLRIGKVFPYFDFSCTENPLKLYEGRFASDAENHSGFTESAVSAVQHTDGYRQRQGSQDDMLTTKNNLLVIASVDNSEGNRVDVLKDAFGGGSWETLLRGSSSTIHESVRDYGCDFQSTFEIPLDYVIDKCLLQEILFQYNYVSRLTIDLLLKGFDLQEHLLALRRYHFMEIADWADLFITSLWHHNWCFTEVDRRTSEVQGLLESSIQRSSCEKDPYRSRLYVYVKDHNTMTPFLTSAVGVRSFDFLGLGYRADWPVSIILTPNALRTYGEIFNFLIKVKLAVLSLTDVWYSLKDFRHRVSQSCEQHQLDQNRFNIIMKLRHQISHFISILQQYVLSQLSDVSWCRFRYSVRHEVRDMMDLESVHMAYLTDSLHICFLSDEAQSVSNIITNILQYALDFHSCLAKKVGNVKLDNRDLTSSLSQINISQVLSVKEKFDKSMKELHLCYLRSSKHVEFGLSRFWSYLNYEAYYSNATGDIM